MPVSEPEKFKLGHYRILMVVIPNRLQPVRNPNLRHTLASRGPSLAPPDRSRGSAPPYARDHN